MTHVTEMTRAEALQEVYYWKKGAAGNFSTKLLELICAADEINKRRIAIAFPKIYFAYLDWYHGNFNSLEDFQKFINIIKRQEDNGIFEISIHEVIYGAME